MQIIVWNALRIMVLQFTRSMLFVISLLIIASGEASSAQFAVRFSQSLNGSWEFVKVSELRYPPPQVAWREINIPRCIFGINYERAWFRRTFKVPAHWRGKRIKIRFGGVKFNSIVYVNGRKVGGHFGGYEPFEVDVTTNIRFNEQNELLVGVHDWTGVFVGERVDFTKLRPGVEARSLPTDRVIAPIGGHYNWYGIWDDVTLIALPNIYIADVFVKPSVRKRMLVVDVTVRNESNAPAKVNLTASVLDGDSKVLTFDATPIAVKPNGEATITLRKRWAKPRLWSPHDPYLYWLDLKLEDVAQQLLDYHRVRFGFREIWTRGPHFYLNGVRIHLLATSWWPSVQPLPHDEVRARLKAIKAMNAIAFRTHTQPWREIWYDMADEIGVMMIIEGAVWNDDTIYRIYDERFWNNYANHLHAMVQRYKNHPSVIMWSLENEFYGSRMNERSPALKQLVRMGQLVKQWDPTRPITYESDGDPGGIADVIGIHYPHEYPRFNRYPNEAYWMDKPIPMTHAFTSPPGTFFWRRTKPLYIGEFLWVPVSSPAPHTILFGDEAYRDFRRYHQLAKAKLWRMQILAYRHYGVSGISPWTVIETGKLDDTNPGYIAHREMYQPLAVFVRQYSAHFFGGERVERTLEVFNDTMRTARVRITWQLKHPRMMAGWGSEEMTLKPAEHKHLKVKLRIPAVRERTKLTFTVAVKEANREVMRKEYTWWAFPHSIAQEELKALHGAVWLYDPYGDTAHALNAIGVQFKRLHRINDLDVRDGRVLIIGANAFAKLNRRISKHRITIGGADRLRDAIARFIQAGGRLLILEQSVYPNGMLPVTLNSYSSTMVHIQLPSHPIVAGLERDDFHCWRDDNIVTDAEPMRPWMNGFRAILVSGSAHGLAHAPLLELPCDDGVLLFCQLKVISKFNREPMARMLLARMLRYLTTYQPPRGRTIVLATNTGNADDWLAKLMGLGLEFQRLSSARQLAQVAYPDVQLLIIRDGISSTDELKQIEQFARAGGRVLLDRPSHELMNALCQQLKLPYRVRPYLGPTVRANGKDQLVEAIAREDLYWLGKHVGRPWSPTPLANNVADGVLMRDAPTKPLAVYEAEQMQLRGSIVQRHHDHVGLFTTGAVEGTIRIPRDGIYVIAITGWGTPLDGIYPLAGIFIDNARVGQLSMSSDKPATFTIEVPLERGEHQLRIGFLNDASRPPQDRNMFVDKIAIGYVGERSDVVFITSPPSVVKIPVGDGAIVLNMLRWDEPPKNKNWIKAQRFILSLLTALGGRFTGGIAYDILEAEWMTPQEGMPWFRREAGYAYMGSNGYIEAKVEIAQPGRYTFKVVARGTQAGGEYPILKLTLDDRTLGEIKLRSDDWALYPLRVSLPKGVHRLRIHFTNDLYQPPEDRNVMIDKLLVVRDTQY